MTDDYNNNTDPEEIKPEDINTAATDVNGGAEQPEAPADAAPEQEAPAEEIKKDVPHTTIPGGTQNRDFYGYRAEDGQYRYVYSRPQSSETQNPYGYQGQGQPYGGTANPGSQGYGYGQNYNGYGYQQNTPPRQQTYQPQYRQPPYGQNTASAQPKKSSGGKIAAVIAVCAALAIIFSTVCLVLGMAIGRRTTGGNSIPDSIVTDREDTQTQKIPEETKETPVTTTETSPLTDPDAKVNTSVSGETLSMTEAAAKTVDSVVEISTEQTVQGSFMQQYVVQGGGSGIIITEDGYIATNNHVIEDATQIRVTLRDGRSFTGTLVGRDSVADLAVVKIDATGLKPATFGDSSKLVVAESVFAIGNPLGELGGTVTQGIISALERTITIDNKEMTLLQTTAAINPGNSGGGLFNLAGECIGVVNAKSSGSGIEGLAFAIPSNTAVKVIQDIIQYGYVRDRVMLGVTMVDVNDQYTLYRYNLREYGVYISKVTENSDAAKAGLKSADRFVSIDGKEVSSSTEVRRIIQKHSVGDTVEIVISRNGTEITFSITLSEYIPTTNLELS